MRRANSAGVGIATWDMIFYGRMEGAREQSGEIGVTFPAWSVYGLGGLFLVIALAVPWLVGWQGRRHAHSESRRARTGTRACPCSGTPSAGSWPS